MNLATIRHTVLHRALPSRLLACALVIALLFAQWAGMRHRIEHMSGQPAAWSHAVQAQTGSNDHDHSNGHAHSCLEFDAATLADCVSSPVFLTPVLPYHHASLAALSCISALVRLRLNFFSHAPPAR